MRSLSLELGLLGLIFIAVACQSAAEPEEESKAVLSRSTPVACNCQ